MKKGFTVIELMVVIVILGTLAAVIGPRIPMLIAKFKGEDKPVYSDGFSRSRSVPIDKKDDVGYGTLDLELVGKYTYEKGQFQFYIFKFRERGTNSDVYVIESPTGGGISVN